MLPPHGHFSSSPTFRAVLSRVWAVYHAPLCLGGRGRNRTGPDDEYVSDVIDYAETLRVQETVPATVILRALQMMHVLLGRGKD